MALFSTYTYGQEDIDDVTSSWKELGFLVGEDKARFVLDLSDAIIVGVSAEDCKELEPKWDTEVKNMTSRFIAAFNSTTMKGDRSFKIGTNLESNLVFFLRVMDVTEKGSNVKAMFEVQDKQGTLLFSTEVKAERGMWGSKLNLMGDALEAIGEKIGKKISSFELDNKEIKSRVRDVIDDGEVIAVQVFISDLCARMLRNESYIRKVTDDLISQMGESFKAGFIDAYGKKHSINNGQMILYVDGYEGSVLNVYLLSFKQPPYTRDKIMRAEYTLITKDGEKSVGQDMVVGHNRKEPHLKIMNKLGSNLGSMK